MTYVLVPCGINGCSKRHGVVSTRPARGASDLALTGGRGGQALREASVPPRASGRRSRSNPAVAAAPDSPDVAGGTRNAERHGTSTTTVADSHSQRRGYPAPDQDGFHPPFSQRPSGATGLSANSFGER